MIILGIDPALTHVGWGVIKASGSSITYLGSGTINTKASEILPNRLAFISLEIEKIIEKFQPNISSMEEVFINMNPQSTLKLSHARGAIMAVIGKYCLELREFAPNKIKKTLVGAGRAEKNQVIYMINLLMPNAKITNPDEADALAAAYACYAHTSIVK